MHLHVSKRTGPVWGSTEHAGKLPYATFVNMITEFPSIPHHAGFFRALFINPPHSDGAFFYCCTFCLQISSRLFFAHVRAASNTLGVRCTSCDGGLPPWAVANGSVSTELCCHPFRCGRYLFMHNGNVGGFNRIRRYAMVVVAS